MPMVIPPALSIAYASPKPVLATTAIHSGFGEIARDLGPVVEDPEPVEVPIDKPPLSVPTPDFATANAGGPGF